MADPVGGGGAATQDEINAYIEKAAANMLGMVMMDIVGEISKEMQTDS